jgi:hypothetical protein
MPNKDLQDKLFKIPESLYNELKMVKEKYNGQETVQGFQRLNNLLNDEKLSYSEMKRLKNYFDNYDGDKSDDEYKLNGGDRMAKWVNNALKIARDSIKKAKKEAGMSNTYIKNRENDQSKNPTKIRIPKIHKSSKANSIYNDEVTYEQTKSKIINLMEKLDRR